MLDEELRKARLLNQQLLLQKQQQQLDGQELPEMSRYMMGEPKEDVYSDEQLVNQHEDQVLIENRRVVDNPNRLKRQENNFDNIRDDIVLPKAQKDHRPLFYTLTTIASAAVLTTLFAATTMGAGAIIACAVGTFGIPSTLFGIFYKKPKNSIDIYDISAKNSRSNTRSNTTRSNNRSLDLNTRRNNVSPIKSTSSSRMPNSLVNLHQANTSNNNVQTPILNSNNGDKNE